MLGLIIGTHAGVNHLRLNVTVLNVTLVVSPLLIALANALLGMSAFNMVLLFALSLAISLGCTLTGLWLGSLGFLAALEACLLKIYLIHK